MQAPRTVGSDRPPGSGRAAVLTVSVLPPGGTPDAATPDAVGPVLPLVPEPVTDGGGDRLVVTRPTLPDRPSATLIAAQQLSDEADRAPHLYRGLDTSAARRRRQRALLVERRAARTGSTPR